MGAHQNTALLSSDKIQCPIAIAASHNPNAPAAVSQSQSISYGQFELAVQRRVESIKNLSLADQERIAVISGNTFEMMVLIFAALRTGNPVVCLSLRLQPTDWADQCRAAKVGALFTQKQYRDQFADLGVPIMTLSDQAIPSELGQNDVNPLESPQASSVPEFDRSREAVIVFTSTVTGHSKGVILSVGNFLSSASASNEITGIGPGDTWLVSLPLFHVGGLGILFRTALSGACAYIPESLSTAAIAELLQRNILTHLSLVPTQLQELVDLALQDDPASLRLLSGVKAIVLAGAPSSERLLSQIAEFNLPVLSAWGMTETTAHCTCMSLRDPKSLCPSVGKPFSHTRLKLVDTHGNEVPTGDVGEILVQGPTVCTGYLYSRDTLPISDSGWLKTGDLGCLDPEGNLSIVGRIDDMFISGGENIHASEIEIVARRFSPHIEVACIPVPHEKWGQRPVLYYETLADSVVHHESFVTFLSERLPRIKVPDRVNLLAKLPRTAIGKVDYKQLKATSLKE